MSAAVEECACTREVAMKVKEQAILTLGSTLAKNNAPAGIIIAKWCCSLCEIRR